VFCRDVTVRDGSIFSQWFQDKVAQMLLYQRPTQPRYFRDRNSDVMFVITQLLLVLWCRITYNELLQSFTAIYSFGIGNSKFVSKNNPTIVQHVCVYTVTLQSDIWRGEWQFHLVNCSFLKYWITSERPRLLCAYQGDDLRWQWCYSRVRRQRRWGSWWGWRLDFCALIPSCNTTWAPSTLVLRVIATRM
jgi:hypothetical protein